MILIEKYLEFSKKLLITFYSLNYFFWAKMYKYFFKTFIEFSYKVR